MSRDSIESWCNEVEGIIREHGVSCTDRVVVVRETASTQDVARQMCAGRAGLFVLAGRQTAGRGRLGRGWADTSHLGVAGTFALDATVLESGRLSVAAGLAACKTVEALISAGPAKAGLRWPNDVVERRERVGCRGGRKLSGVLIEQSRGIAFVGIGINVSQGDAEWPDELAPRAASLRQLGSTASRIEVACRLVIELDRALASTEAQLEREWCDREVLLGSRQEFEHGGERFSGTVTKVSPVLGIELRGDDGRVHHLPALTTSLIHE